MNGPFKTTDPTPSADDILKMPYAACNTAYRQSVEEGEKRVVLMNSLIAAAAHQAATNGESPENKKHFLRGCELAYEGIAKVRREAGTG